MWWPWLVACVAALLSWGPARRWWRLRRLASRLRGPPFPGVSLASPVDALRRLAAQYGTPCKLWAGPRLYVVISKPEHVRAVLSGGSSLDRDFHQTNVIRSFTGDGLLTAKGDDWRRRRALVSRVFGDKWLQAQLPWLGRVADRLLSLLRRSPTPHLLDACSLDMVAGCVVGMQTRALGQKEQAGFAHQYFSAVRLLDAKVSWSPCYVSLPLSSEWLEQRRLARALRGYVEASVHDALDGSTTEQEGEIVLPWERDAQDPDRVPGSALEALLAVSSERRLLVEELSALLLAGHVTTAAALRFTLQLLALHPKIQEVAARDEAVLERAISESLRLFPPSPLISREISEDLPLPGTDLVLPAGCTAVVDASFTHRDPQVWPDPLTFNPDRFLPEACLKRDPFSYLPYGAGPRACVGDKLAHLLVKTTLSRILPVFKVTTTASRLDLEDLRMGLVATPRAGFDLHFEPRQ